MTSKAKLMQGNEACLLGALAAGMEFYAGYPITPSTEIAEYAAEELPKIGGKFIQMEDEIAGMAATIGASLAGKKSMTATSGPGFSLKQENIGFACIAEVPCVIVNVMRGGPSSGLPTSPSQGDVMQARWGTHGDHPVIALAPSSVKECFDMTVKAFNLSEELRVPVVILSDEIIGHMREKVELPEPGTLTIVNRKKPLNKENYKPFEADPDGGIPPMACYGEGFRFHVTGLIHDETGFPSGKPDVTDRLIRRINKKIDNNLEKLWDYETESTEDAEILLVAYGSTARTALSAVRKARKEGLKVGILRPKTIWPFPEKIMSELAQKVRDIIVPEMNLGQLVYEVERINAGRAKVHSLSKVDGELFKPEHIFAKILEVK